MRGREAVQQCRLKEKDGREEEGGRRRGEVEENGRDKWGGRVEQKRETLDPYNTDM